MIRWCKLLRVENPEHRGCAPKPMRAGKGMGAKLEVYLSWFGSKSETSGGVAVSNFPEKHPKLLGVGLSRDVSKP